MDAARPLTPPGFESGPPAEGSGAPVPPSDGRVTPMMEQYIERVGWVEQSEIHHLVVGGECDGFRKGSTHPTGWYQMQMWPVGQNPPPCPDARMSPSARCGLGPREERPPAKPFHSASPPSARHDDLSHGSVRFGHAGSLET
jgi:hypothetical protein